MAKTTWGGRLGRGVLLACLPFMVGSTGLRTNFEERLLAAHNRARAELGIGPLEWNPALAEDAREWATELRDTGRFEHDHRHRAVPEGENIWGGSPGYFAPEAMVDAWNAEKQYFKPGTFPNNSTTGSMADIGHYTQLMWRKTGQVGCAIAQGPREDVLVCRYAQAGNVIGQNPF